MSRAAGMLAAAALVVAGLLVPATPTHASPTAHSGPTEDIAALVNEARWANGQAGLIRNPAMDQVAANWAAQMAASGAIAHNPDYASQIPAGWTSAGENVAQGHPTGAAMHEGWMASSGHRANILGDYTDIGIAFLSSGGTTWGVEVFARYPGHAGPAAPAPPAPPPAAEPEAPAEPEPVATETPTATPTPEATVTATRTATPEPQATASSRPADSSAPPWWPLLAGVLLVGVAGTATAVLRRRRSTVRRG